MKKYIPLLAVSLLVSLFIYVFYRTERTLVNQVIISVFSQERYSGIKTAVTSIVPLSDLLVYSLPEGLWIFCITLTSSFFYIEAYMRRWRLVFVPLLVALIMETFQLLHITRGRFDKMDVLFAVGFWLLALIITRADKRREAPFHSFNTETLCCSITYFIVYLAHVIS